MSLVIYTRTLVEVNTDPQRRCYWGAHAKSEMQWTDWDVLESDVPPDRVEYRLKFWWDLNDYSVSVGGLKRQYEIRRE